MAYKDKNKQREYCRNWIARRRALWFLDKFCSCGSQVDLELDHIDPATKISHAIWSWSAERREKELAKCQVLCYDCHLKKTNEYKRLIMQRPITHGTHSGYTRGCRCKQCREIHNAYNKSWRLSRGNAQTVIVAE